MSKKTPTKKIVCLTQSANIQVFSGPSNRTYQSIKGSPFLVEGDEDINFFLSKSSRFKAIGFVETLKRAVLPDEPVIDDSSELEAFLETLQSLSKTSRGKILTAYQTISEVRDDLETGKNRFSIPDAQRLDLSIALGLTTSLETIDEDDVVGEDSQ